MATWDDVRRLALALPRAHEHSSFGNQGLAVNKKAFAWERPLRRGDIEALGKAALVGPILAASVEHVGMKDALIATDPRVYFTIPHFDGYAAILVRLERITLAELEQLLLEAWLSRAPKQLVKDYLATH